MANFFKSLFKGKKEEENENGNGTDKTNQKNFEILKYDGIRAQRMGRVDYAIKCYSNALDILEDFEVMNYLSQIYSRIDEPEKACKLLEKMIEMEPQVIDSYLFLANVHFMQEAYPQMVEVLEKGMAVSPENATVHYLSGKAKKGLKEHKEAIAHLTKAINLQNDFIEALLMRAEVYMETEQCTEASADLEKIFQVQADEEHALLLRGKLNEATGKPEEAEKDYRKVTELNPFHDQAFIYLAQLYINQNRLLEALELCDDAIELNPGSAELYHERGRTKLLIGDTEGSQKDMELATQMNAEKEGNEQKQAEQPENKQENSLGLPFS